MYRILQKQNQIINLSMLQIYSYNTIKILLVIFLTVYTSKTFSQNVNGGLINVAQHSPAFINFPDEINNIELDNPSGKEFFFLKIRSDKMLSITYKGKSTPPPVGLIISEGKRTHHFRINYIENYNINKDPSLYYDYSDVKVLRKYVESLKNDKTQSNLLAQAEADKEAFKKKEGEIAAQRAADDVKRKQEEEILAKKRLAEEEELKKKSKAQELAKKQKELEAQRKLEDDKRKEDERKRQEAQKRDDERRAEEERQKQARIQEEQRKQDELRRQEEQKEIAAAKEAAERERQKELERKNKEAEEQRRLAAEKAKQDSIALVKAKEELRIQELKDKQAKEEAAALAKKLEEERKASELAEKKAKEEKERKAKEESARIAREEKERKDREVAEQKRLAAEKAKQDSIASAIAKEELRLQQLKEKQEKEAAAALAKKLEEEKLALEAAEKKAKEEKERIAKEEEARIAREEKERKELLALQEKQKREEEARIEKERKAEEDRLKKIELARIEAEKQEKIAAEKKAALEKLEKEKEQQKIERQYSEIGLWERYGSKGIILHEMPTEQYKLNNTDFYLANDTLKNYNVAQKIINTETKIPLNLKSNEFADGVMFNLEEIVFEGFNTYYKIKIDNKSKDDFLMGPIAMYWYNADKSPKMPVFCSYVTYIGFFPLVRPNTSQTIVYVTRTINMQKGEDLMLNIKERRAEKGYGYTMISDKIYNQELDKTDKVIQINEDGGTSMPKLDNSANRLTDPKKESSVIQESKQEIKQETKEENGKEATSKKKKKSKKNE